MKKKLTITLLLFISGFLITISGQNLKMFSNAAGDNEWFNPNNWIPIGIPEINDKVIIPPLNYVEVKMNPVYLQGLENNGRIFGCDSNGVSFFVEEQIDNNGFFENVYTLQSGAINNSGSITGCDSNGVLFFVEDQIDNNGFFKNVNTVQSGTIINSGSITGAEGYDLWITARSDFENRGWVCCDSNGVNIFAKNEFRNNGGTVKGWDFTWVKASIIDNSGSIFSNRNLTITSSNQFYNFGLLGSCDSNGVSFFPNDINITCINPFGTALFYNLGTIQGGIGAPGIPGDNIFFRTDDFRNRGLINGGLPGSGENIPGGHVSVWSNLFDNAGVIYAPSGEASFLANIFKHNPVYNDSPANLNKANLQMIDPSGEFFRIEADAVFIHSKEMYFGNMGAFGSGTTLIGPDAIYLTNTNDADALMDFSENNSAGTIVSNTLIALQSNNIIEPAGGIETLCSIAPRINQGGTDFYGMFLYVDDIIDTSGNSRQVEVFLKNQCSFGRDFAYVISSVLGWVDYDSTNTAFLDPWELFTVNADYNIPDNLEEITVDTVKIKAVLSEFATNSRVFLITGIPRSVVSVKDNFGIEPGNYFLSQNYPNPFNPATTIKFGLPNDSYVKLEVFNILGEKVSELINKGMTAGYHSINFDGSNLSSGIYFYKITAGDFVSTKKLLLIK